VTRRLPIVLAVAAAVVAIPGVALGDSSGRASNSATFADSIGEDPSAPDITSVAVSNDDTGAITFQVNVSNRPSFTQDMYFLLFLDTDQRTSTGDPDFSGADYIVQLAPGAVDLFKWNGTEEAPAPSQSSLTYAYTASGPAIHVKAVDLGKTTGIGFRAIAVSGVSFDASGNPDFTNIHRDAAPDPGHGFFAYQVRTRLVLSATAFTTSPKPARAGRAYSASLAASQNDTGGPVQGATVACSATIAFKRIVATTHVVTNGIGSCVWRIPATAKGKTLRGTISLTLRGVKVTRSFSSRIA
jgi:hypothetical protein